MTITLTREEAHGLLAALEELNRLSIGKDAICLPAEIDTAMEMLEARLSAPEPEPVKLRRGDILRCIETNELCTVWATSTTGKTLVKWKANDFGSYTAEQIGDLFWVEPKPECVCGEPKEKSDSKQTMQLALDALVKWQKICLAKNRSAKELTTPTKAIFALNAALAQGEPK